MSKLARIKKVNKPPILIISNTLDFATDYVCLELEQRKLNYLRVNRDLFAKYKIVFDVNRLELTISINGKRYLFSKNSLKAVYYRAPIYLRDIYQPGLSKEAQLYRTQWASFVRNLAVFEKAFWMNNPVSTFRAENKILQLYLAQKSKFKCPHTFVTNSKPKHVKGTYAVKSLDTALMRFGNKEAFTYTTILEDKEIAAANFALAPVVFQNYLSSKIDWRVTVVGETVYPVKVLKNNAGVFGDWRKDKGSLQFVSSELPKAIEKKCVQLLKQLQLSFGAIDLIETSRGFNFIEINPTGEWAWLVDAAELNIQKGICDVFQKNL